MNIRTGNVKKKIIRTFLELNIAKMFQAGNDRIKIHSYHVIRNQLPILF